MNFSVITGFIILSISLFACSDDSLNSVENFNEAETFFCDLLSDDAKKECLETIRTQKKSTKKDFLINADINIQIRLDSGLSPVSRKKPKDEICTLCKNSIRTYEKMINRTRNATEIQKPLIRACSIYNCEFQHYCILFFEGKGLKVIKDILHKKEPTKICQTMHLCRRERKFDLPHTFLDMFVSLSKRKRKNLCQTCLKSVKYSEEYINTTNTPEEVQQFIFDICDIFTNQYQNVCRTYFSTTGFEIIKHELSKEDPKIICQKLNFCPNKTDQVQSNILNNILEKPHHKKPDEVCSLCKHLVGEYEKMINTSMNATDIQIPLVKACSIYNCDLQHYCILFFQNTGFEAIKSILHKGNPQKICQKMKVCQKKRNNIPHEILFDLLIPVTKKRSRDLCKSCIRAVKYSENYINTTNTPEEVLQMILDICEIFQTEYKESCKQYASTTGLEIIQKALNKEDSKTICQSLKFCHSERIRTRDAVHFSNDYVCNKITAIMNEKALQTKTKMGIKRSIAKACDGINILQDKCLQFVRENIEKLFQIVVENLPQEFICKIMDNSLFLADVEDCKVCREIVFIVDRLAIPYKDEQSLNYALSRACDYLPISSAEECHAFVVKFRSEVVKLFLEKVYWEDICVRLQICQSSHTKSNGNEENLNFLPKVNYGFNPQVV